MIISFTFHESQPHGTPDFPVGYYYIDASHPRYNMPFHWHKEWEIIRVLKGTFTVHADDEIFTARAGDILLLRDGMLHGGIPENCTYECILFDLHGLFNHLDITKKYLRPFYRQELLPRIFYPADEMQELNRIIAGLSNTLRQDSLQKENPLPETCNINSKAPGTSAAYFDSLSNPMELIVISCISRLFSLILTEQTYVVNHKSIGESTTKIDLIKTILEHIEYHYASPLTLESLANVVGMNPKYFCRFFRSITHQTPMSYVNAYRVEKAAQMLHSTRLPITDICMDCGFNDSSNFIKVFRKYKGMTPKQYRKG